MYGIDIYLPVIVLFCDVADLAQVTESSKSKLASSFQKKKKKRKEKEEEDYLQC